MSISRMIRWGGLAGAAGGVLWVVLLAVYAALPTAAAGELRSGGENVVLFAVPLINVGIVALYGHQRRRAGWFARFALAVGCAGFVLNLFSRLLTDFADVPESWLQVSSVVYFAGLLLFGWSAFVAGEVPAPAAALLLASTIVLPFARFEDARAWAAAPFGVAWVWLGWAVWRGRRTLRPAGVGFARPVSFVIAALRPADHTS